MPNKKPFKIFIGSSTENKKYATWVSDLISDIEKDEPDKFYEVTANGWWEKGIFRLMNSFYESLNDLVANFDAGIFIGGMEDLTIKRDKEGFQPRDNIILELGMFAGAKGKYLSLLTTIDIPELPSDLAGINVVNLKSTTDYNLFQKEARAHFREWLVLAKESRTKSETINKMHIHDPEIESIIVEFVCTDDGNPTYRSW
jgi:predicted nucleotide-binding protein